MYVVLRDTPPHRLHGHSALDANNYELKATSNLHDSIEKSGFLRLDYKCLNKCTVLVQYLK